MSAGIGQELLTKRLHGSCRGGFFASKSHLQYAIKCMGLVLFRTPPNNLLNVIMPRFVCRPLHF
eukprot:3633435-Amphidinium_carterae.1